MEKKRNWILFLVGVVIVVTLIVAIIQIPIPIGLSPESACKPSLKAITDSWGPYYSDYCGGDWIVEDITYSSSSRAQLSLYDGTNFAWCNVSKIGPFWVTTNGGVTLINCLQGF
ncbi:MAG: hypothetical protein AB1750_14155 [Chloroflexota bacterium]